MNEPRDQTTLFAPRGMIRQTPCMVCGDAPIHSMKVVADGVRPWPVCDKPTCFETAQRMHAND